ncbi:hypothetical protein [Candidatus Nitrosocosmicus sp. FF01]
MPFYIKSELYKYKENKVDDGGVEQILFDNLPATDSPSTSSSSSK